MSTRDPDESMSHSLVFSRHISAFDGGKQHMRCVSVEVRSCHRPRRSTRRDHRPQVASLPVMDPELEGTATSLERTMSSQSHPWRVKIVDQAEIKNDKLLDLGR